MAFELSPLPYDTTALTPHVSARTLELQHGKHHAAYVTGLNKLIAGTKLNGWSLEGIITATANSRAKVRIFNNAAQCWNHDFYWKSMTPGGGGKPGGDLAAKIDTDFGGYDKFAGAFSEAAATQFGTGWVWLVANNDGTLSVMATDDADLPLAHGKHALLCLDVWEHAYYLDYQNRRPDYVTAFLQHLLNWKFAEANLHNLRAVHVGAQAEAGASAPMISTAPSRA